MMRISWKIVGVFLAVSALDILTTSYGLSMGFTEGNPLIRSASGLLLKRYILFTAMGVLILLPYSYYNRYLKAILAGMIVIKSILPLNNLLLIAMNRL